MAFATEQGAAILGDQDLPSVIKYKKKRHASEVSGLPDDVKRFLEQLTPNGEKLKSLQQIGMPATERDVLTLFHETLSSFANDNVYIRPFIFTNIFQSANSVASWISQCLVNDFTWAQIESCLVQVLSSSPQPILHGMKISVKGRLNRKADKASKTLWSWGLTSVATFDDYVDYAEDRALTTAGYVGIKVWVIYKPGVMPKPKLTTRAPMVPMHALLKAPRSPIPLRSSSAWWRDIS